MIKVIRGGSLKEVEIINLTKEDGDYYNRKWWCEHDLAEFWKSTKCGIKDIDYYLLKDHSELIRIYYDAEKQYFKDCWISGDSLAAIAEDMFRQHVVY